MNTAAEKLVQWQRIIKNSRAKNKMPRPQPCNKPLAACLTCQDCERREAE